MHSCKRINKIGKMVGVECPYLKRGNCKKGDDCHYYHTICEVSDSLKRRKLYENL